MASIKILSLGRKEKKYIKQINISITPIHIKSERFDTTTSEKKKQSQNGIQKNKAMFTSEKNTNSNFHFHGVYHIEGSIGRCKKICSE